MTCLIEGCNFLLKNIHDEVFTYQRHGNPEYRFPIVDPCIFPYLLVNIGSGVSIMKVSNSCTVLLMCMGNKKPVVFLLGGVWRPVRAHRWDGNGRRYFLGSRLFADQSQGEFLPNKGFVETVAAHDRDELRVQNLYVNGFGSILSYMANCLVEHEEKETVISRKKIRNRTVYRAPFLEHKKKITCGLFSSQGIGPIEAEGKQHLRMARQHEKGTYKRDSWYWIAYKKWRENKIWVFLVAE